MAYPTNPANGQKVGANLVPRPAFPDTGRGAWSVGDVAARDIGGGVMRNRLSNFTVTTIPLPGVPVAAAQFRITALIITTNSQCYMGVRPIGSTELVGNVLTGSTWQWVTITDSIGAGETGSGLELYLRTPTVNQLGIAAVRVDYADSPVSGYFDGDTPDTASELFTWDGAAFASASSVAAVVAGDTTAPSAPTGLAVTARTENSVSLAWSAATDNVGVTGYRVYGGATLVSSVLGTEHTVTGLAAGSTHTYVVKAVDAAGNESVASAPVTATTLTTGQPPQPTPEPGLPTVPEAAQRVAAFLGQATSPQTLQLAAQAVPVVTLMAKAYTRDQGFTGGEPNDEIAAVITMAAGRLVTNPEQLDVTVGMTGVRGAFQGWNLAELAVLNRYRRRAV